MGFINAEGHAASVCLAEERGPFPAYAESVFPQRGEGPYRNATVTTIAPTGTLSIIGGCSRAWSPCSPSASPATSWTASAWWK